MICNKCGAEMLENAEKCTACGEVCNCMSQEQTSVSPDKSAEANEYFEIHIKKETVEKLKDGVANAKETIGSLRQDASVVQGIDGKYEHNLKIVDECIVPTERKCVHFF